MGTFHPGAICLILKVSLLKPNC